MPRALADESCGSFHTGARKRRHEKLTELLLLDLRVDGLFKVVVICGTTDVEACSMRFVGAV